MISINTHFFKLLILVLVFGLSVAWKTKVSAANFFQETWSVVTDPFKLRQSSQTLADSLDRSLVQLRELESVTNYDVKERLEQIRTILKDVIDGSDLVISRATRSMIEIESKINEDAINIIYNSKCAIDVTLKSTAEESLTILLNQISETRPRVRFMGVTSIDFATKKLGITNPNIAYKSAKEAAIIALSDDLLDDSGAYRIFFAYQNLQAAAKYALCYYLLHSGPAGQKLWVNEVNDMERLITPWTVVLIPNINFRDGGEK